MSNSKDKVFEMRTYTTHEGKLQDLHDRFREHSIEILSRHGMESVAYWVPEDPELSNNTLIYIITHESRDIAEENWQSFFDDPEWQRVYEESHADGPLVDEVESVFMKATPYSPLQ
ncbi:MAG: NIPSNAP family protein [Balneolaceae bacterium]